MININTNDLENARTAEINPLDNAVNIPLAKILKPINKSAMVQILFPVIDQIKDYIVQIEIPIYR